VAREAAVQLTRRIWWSDYVSSTLSRRRVARCIAGVTVASFSVIILLAAFDLVFPSIITELPLDARRFVPPPYDRLAENTKEGTIPRNYIAIVGDSYAYGLGDWVLQVLDSSWWTAGKPFDSASVIHDALSADVVSLANAGFGSVRSIALNPMVALQLLYARFHIEPPRLFLVYFYEGNDLSDNLEELRSAGYDTLPRGPSSGNRLSSWLWTQATSEVHNSDSGRFLGLKLLLALSQNAWERLNGRGEAIPELRTRRASEDYNRAKFESGIRALPDRLDGPALELSPAETDVAIDAFQQSLAFLVASFPHSRVAVVYIPAVLSCYPFEGAVSAHTAWSRPRVYLASMVNARSRDIGRRIRTATLQTGAAFIDPRPALRAEATRTPIHGPRDWRHFNRLGYETLGRVIVSWLRVAEWPLLTRFSLLQASEPD
jgi:hypothetical protein